MFLLATFPLSIIGAFFFIITFLLAPDSHEERFQLSLV